MSTQKQLSRTTGTERMFKEELALSLICWVFTSPFTNWTDKVFSGIEVPSEGPSTLLGEAEKFFRFVVNEEGYDAGRAALGLDLCCFSLPSCLFPDAALSEEEVMSKLTEEVIHGILLSLPEFIDMPEVLAYGSGMKFLLLTLAVETGSFMVGTRLQNCGSLKSFPAPPS